MSSHSLVRETGNRNALFIAINVLQDDGFDETVLTPTAYALLAIGAGLGTGAVRQAARSATAHRGALEKFKDETLARHYPRYRKTLMRAYLTMQSMSEC